MMTQSVMRWRRSTSPEGSHRPAQGGRKSTVVQLQGSIKLPAFLRYNFAHLVSVPLIGKRSSVCLMAVYPCFLRCTHLCGGVHLFFPSQWAVAATKIVRTVVHKKRSQFRINAAGRPGFWNTDDTGDSHHSPSPLLKHYLNRPTVARHILRHKNVFPG